MLDSSLSFVGSPELRFAVVVVGFVDLLFFVTDVAVAGNCLLLLSRRGDGVNPGGVASGRSSTTSRLSLCTVKPKTRSIAFGRFGTKTSRRALTLERSPPVEIVEDNLRTVA